MKRAGILLSMLATLVNVGTGELGRQAFLCIGDDGHVAIEDPASLCCGGGDASRTTCSSQLEVTAQRSSCVDIPLRVDPDRTSPPAMSRAMAARGFALAPEDQFFAAIPTGLLTPGPCWSLPSGAPAIAHLRTFVLRC